MVGKGVGGIRKVRTLRGGGGMVGKGVGGIHKVRTLRGGGGFTLKANSILPFSKYKKRKGVRAFWVAPKDGT